MDPEITILLIVLAMGLCFGSFISLASWRLPRDEDLVVAPSRCPSCRTTLLPADMVPVFSWLAFKAKCRHCSTRISWRYPAIELVTALVFLWIYFKFGVSLQSLVLALFAVTLLVMIVVDFEHYLIPDEIHCVLVPLGIAYIYVVGLPWVPMALGAAVGLGIGLALRYGYRFLRGKEGLGMGDVKFLAVCGLWLGVKPIIPFLFFAGIFGVLTAVVWRALGKGQLFPFGPALAMSLFMSVACPEIPNMFYNIGMII